MPIKLMRPEEPFDLTAEVLTAYEQFPQLLKETYFVDVVRKAVVHPRLSKKSQAHFRHPLFYQALQAVNRENRSAYYGRLMNEKNTRDAFVANIVFLHLRPETSGFGVYPETYTSTQRQRAVFDHELGHALTLRTKHELNTFRGPANTLIAETMADSFMLLRQYVRYQGNEAIIRAEDLLARTVSDFLFGPTSQEHYFTAPAMGHIVSLSKDFNLAALAPQKMLRLARDVAIMQTPSSHAFAQIRQTLKPARRKNTLAELARRTLDTKLRQAFKWGSMALSYKMGDGFIPDQESLAFKRKKWPAVQEALRAKQARGY